MAELLAQGNSDSPRPNHFVPGPPQHDMAGVGRPPTDAKLTGIDDPHGGSDSNNFAVLVLAAHVQLDRDSLS